MDKYFNFGKNEFIINNLESDNFVERNEADQEVTGNLEINGDLNVSGTLTANEMVTNGDISTTDGLIEHLVIEGEEPVNNKNFGDYAEYRESETDKFKGYAIGAGEDKLYVFANTTSRPLQDTNLHLLPKGSVSVRLPQTSDECANKEYVDNHTGGNYLPLTGGTMTGNILMNINNTNSNNINKTNELTFNELIGVKLRFFDRTATRDVFTIELQDQTTVYRTGNNFAFYNKGIYNSSRFNPGTGGTVFLTMDGENGNVVKIHNLLDMNNKKIINVSNASELGDAVNYSQLLTRLSTSGGTMTGPLNFDPNIYIRTSASRDGKIAIGMGGTPSNKGDNSIGIGSFSGQTDQGEGAIAIGAAAGYGSQGPNAIAIGNLAGYTGNNSSTSQASNSIILNATGTNYTTGQTNSFNVKPIRNSNSNDKMLKYNPTSGEITYHNDVNVQTVQKLAVYLNNVTTSSNVGTHTFEFDEPLTNTTSFLITVNFNEEYTGTFANSSQVTVDYSFRNISNGVTSQVSKSFYPFVKDIGGSNEFISQQFKVLLGASITTKKLVIDIDDGYTTGTKTYYHTIEVERVN